MDTTNQISAYVKRMTFSNDQSYLPADRLIDMNDIYKECIKNITSKVQDFFWTWGYSNSVAGQYEYTIDSFGSLDILSIDSVSIKYKSDGDYIKLDKGDFNSLGSDFDNYADWGGKPFYFVRDKSIFIAPVAPESVTDGWKIYGNYRPEDLTLSDSTTEIRIPLLYTKVIAYGMCMNYWMAQ